MNKQLNEFNIIYAKFINFSFFRKQSNRITCNKQVTARPSGRRPPWNLGGKSVVVSLLTKLMAKYPPVGLTFVIPRVSIQYWASLWKTAESTKNNV